MKLGIAPSLQIHHRSRRWEVPVPRAIEVIYSSSSGEGTDPRFVKLAPVFRCSMLKSGDKKRLIPQSHWFYPGLQTQVSCTRLIIFSNFC
ncbi:hypothetical protein RchiOBHm_Chr7g0223981 [Rosa chinensis]|uniref:Uncharacterized protein n=1 Tax=Rosa chinensis TaxID=74649 RepID=A0A2P6PDP8_ROSCH|nr:hypothetical protein RchiOBHm_Chr7g0223981 [Rosa chinensis]